MCSKYKFCYLFHISSIIKGENLVVQGKTLSRQMTVIFTILEEKLKLKYMLGYVSSIIICLISFYVSYNTYMIHPVYDTIIASEASLCRTLTETFSIFFVRSGHSKHTMKKKWNQCGTQLEQ